MVKDKIVLLQVNKRKIRMVQSGITPKKPSKGLTCSTDAANKLGFTECLIFSREHGRIMRNPNNGIIILAK